jgi:hypothetical protein
MISVSENFLFWKSVFFFTKLYSSLPDTKYLILRERQSYYVNLSLALSGVNSCVEGREVNFA